MTDHANSNRLAIPFLNCKIYKTLHSLHLLRAKGTMNGTAFGSTLILTHAPAFRKGTSALNTHHLPSTIQMCKCPTIRALSSEEIPPNALRRKRDPTWRGGFSLGVDLGMSRTGLAVSKGFSIRPLTVLELRGQKLELRLIEIAERQEVDEFIIGLPKSCDGKETQQSNKVRSVAGRFAVRAAESGLRRCRHWLYICRTEHGTSTEAMNLMIDRGISKSARQGRIDAYAAMMVLERYFSCSGHEIELVLPKQLELQEKLRIGPPTDVDFLIDEFDGFKG
ncbi:hypothetical protein HYC85_016643 [Camellia sinensis]|uniref:YqgF/RNase H-like domain-containing protein n=1 Tax=Camellia sinensis TaxID=4442 RepID=A0A7J7H1J4_CAMSI|nr:hypothetical protein HYC85_016643 [Camellia sinensis]